MPVLRDSRFRNLSQEPGSDDNHFIIDIMIAIGGKTMAKTGLANAYVTVGELAVDGRNTAKIIVLAPVDEMDMDNLDTSRCCHNSFLYDCKDTK